MITVTIIAGVVCFFSAIANFPKVFFGAIGLWLVMICVRFMP